MKSLALIAFATLTAMGASPAAAVTIVYTDQGAFNAAVTNLQNYAFSAGSSSGSIFTAGPVTVSAPEINKYDDGSYGPNPYLATGYSTRPVNVTSTTSALGLVLGSFFGARNITYTVDRNVTGSFVAPGNPATTFLGFINTTGAASVAFNTTSELDILAVSAGARAISAVPEPTAWAMMISGMALVGGSLRRRRRTEQAAATFA